jgi:small conductance mechanosensitive channel
MIVNLYDLINWTNSGYPSIRILIIWILAWMLLRFIRRILQALRTHIAGRVNEGLDLRRMDTLTNVFRYAANVVVTGLAIMLTLSVFGISIAPLLATAGVAGIAIGFGAQSLVKDFFTGLFLLLENQVSEGDLIEVAGKTGYVERVTLRHIRIRDYDGSVHFIPNGMITLVTNRSREFGYAVIDVNIPRQQDPDRVLDMMRGIAAEMRNDPDYSPSILEDIDIAGVEKLEDATLGLRCRLKVLPARQWRVRREFLKRMKYALDQMQDTTKAAQEQTAS